ncbi:MAG: serine/threonine-protein kinase, partial [Candidatus Aminicenantaceae bacterium]
MKCPKCHSENSDTAKFCAECGTQVTPIEDAQPSFTKTLETPVEELKRGTLFAGRYEIIEELGKGGMGKVYRVFDKKIESEVALKLVRSDIAADKNTVERFRNELKLARDITHKSVCRMYDLNEEQGTHYITMEYVSGGDLKRFIRRSGQLSIGTALKIAIQLCEGLSEAHKLGVIHRDLKPNNIMIDAQGNARIMDFGIARSLSTKGITARGVMIGTPEYMSPEQVEGKDVDQRSDIYSLGIILYEMVTGRVPFEGDTPFTIGVKHKSETPKDPREFNTQISDELSDVILKCLEKEKENRYQNTGEVLSVLTQIEKGIPTTERPALKSKSMTSREITVRFTPKRLLVPVAVILILAIIAYVIFRRPAVKLDPNRVVVGIFENQTGIESLNRLGQYAAHTISEGLSQTGMFDIVPFDAVLHYVEAVEADKGGLWRRSDIRQLARESGAGTEITGTYNLFDETLSFHIQIIDVGNGKSLVPVTKTDGRDEDEVQIVQELNEKIAGALASHFNFNYGKAYDYTPPLYAA